MTVERHRAQWEAIGASDPYWGVLTDPAKKGGRWDKAEFFASGEAEIADWMARLAELGIRPGSGVALDYGCGVGRLSRALSSRFQRVIGVDMSAAMLGEARSANAAYHSVSFVQNDGSDLQAIASDSVDLVYSNITLQHSPASNQAGLIREFCRVLRPGGVCVFQTPSHPNLRTRNGFAHLLLGNRILNIARRSIYGASGVMEVHTLAKAKVSRILTASGVRLRHTIRFDSAGPSLVSFMYIGEKRSSV